MPIEIRSILIFALMLLLLGLAALIPSVNMIVVFVILSSLAPIYLTIAILKDDSADEEAALE